MNENPNIINNTDVLFIFSSHPWEIPKEVASQAKHIESCIICGKDLYVFSIDALTPDMMNESVDYKKLQKRYVSMMCARVLNQILTNFLVNQEVKQ